MSLSQGELNFDLVPRLEATPEAEAATDIDATLIAAVKSALGGQVTDVRASQRLTDSAACRVARSGPDRELERLLGPRRRRLLAGPVFRRYTAPPFE
jgi:molecular chaperone HtpG